MCNRVFGYEAVEETFYQLEDGSSQRALPVALAGRESRHHGDLDGRRHRLVAVDRRRFCRRGTHRHALPQVNTGAMDGVIDVQYSGGYQLPDGAPATLRYCTEALIREGYMSWIRSPGSFGVRQISHKEARIGYFAPNMFPTLGLPATWTQLQSNLEQIRQRMGVNMRHEQIALPRPAEHFWRAAAASVRAFAEGVAPGRYGQAHVSRRPGRADHSARGLDASNDERCGLGRPAGAHCRSRKRSRTSSP